MRPYLDGLSAEFGLPAVDPFTQGTDAIIDQLSITALEL